MRILDSVCAAGGTPAGDDRLGHDGTLAWVIDGATSVETEPFLPAATDVQWLADSLDRLLHERGRRAYSGSGRRLLLGLSRDLGAELRSRGFPAGRLHPTCSVGLLIDQGHSFELTRIGDATCVTTGAPDRELSTAFFDRREASAVAAAPAKGLATPAARAGLAERRQEYILGVHAESVFSGHPQARLRTHSLACRWSATQHVLLCTDGFARAVTDYGLFSSWRDLTATALGSGLHAVLAAIRHHERTAPAPTGRFKQSDDAAAILITR